MVVNAGLPLDLFWLDAYGRVQNRAVALHAAGEHRKAGEELLRQLGLARGGRAFRRRDFWLYMAAAEFHLAGDLARAVRTIGRVNVQGLGIMAEGCRRFAHDLRRQFRRAKRRRARAAAGAPAR